MSGVVLRPARIDELDELTDVCMRSKAIWGYDRAFLEACRAELTMTEVDLLDDWVCVAEADGGAVGVVQLSVSGSDAEIDKLFIRPGILRRGLGARLFGAASDRARSQGASQLVVAADPGAVPFYERMGARLSGMVPSGSIAGRMLPRLLMEL